MNFCARIYRISTFEWRFIIILMVCLTLAAQLIFHRRQIEFAMNSSNLIQIQPLLLQFETETHGNDSLIDLNDFQFLSPVNDQLCSNGHNKNSLLLILILSARDNLKIRNIIRGTWGSLNSIGNWTIKYVYLLGASTNRSLDTKIMQESKKHQDMVVGNFVDSYRNLSYKHIMGYKWALRYCSEAEYVVKTDDDVFVDTFQLVNYMESLINQDNIIACYINYQSIPQRTLGSKWLVTKQEFPNKTYPNYCMGMGWLMSFDVVGALYEASETVPYFWVEDAYISGILREHVNKQLGTPVSLKDMNQTHIFSDELFLWLYNNKFKKDSRFVFIHFWEEEIQLHFKQLWRFVVKRNKK